jgi:hypothetical protein
MILINVTGHVVKTNTEHLLTTCHHFKHEQLALRRKLGDLPPESGLFLL